MVNARDLAYMRASLEELLPDTCTIRTEALTTSDVGGQKRTSTDTYTAVPCRVGRITEQVRVGSRSHGDQPQEVADWMVTLPWDQTVALGNRIVTATRVLEIVDINADKSFKAGTRVLCREIVSG